MGKKLFDYVIGNPPYQEEVEGNGRSNPVYNLFMDASYEVGDVVELITPARFLYNAGQTPKAWNKKMLEDEHLKVLDYAPDSSKVFSNTEIKGGVAVTLRDANKEIGPIGFFSGFDELSTIVGKVDSSSSLMELVVGAVPYRFTEKVNEEHPEFLEDISSSFDLRSNVFDKLQDKLFFDEKIAGEECIKIIGLYKKKRTEKWIARKYVSVPSNFECYKVLLPESNGTGAIGEVLPTPQIVAPLIGHTQTYISIGFFQTKGEAEALIKYIKTKFSRTMLGILKVTQHKPRSVWQFVPLQDFTPSSDIDWSKSVHEIDLQLYRKYGLDEKEIEFIETHVKEMA